MNSSHRAYVPTNAHSNQYILAEFKPSKEFYAQYQNAEDCYNKLSQKFFRVCEDEGLHNVHFIANDKLPVVRFHSEYLCFQTDKQMLFFYNPQYHEAQNLFVKPEYQARKVRLLFLATGDEIRANSAEFHKSVHRVLKKFKSELPDLPVQLKVRDHQHLSFDGFARSKGHKETYAYKLRSLYARYEKRNCDLPQPRSELTYVTVPVPLTRRIKRALGLQGHDYAAMYEKAEQAFKSACDKQGLHRLALVANGKTPLVRNSKADVADTNRELQKISFDPAGTDPQSLSFWTADNLAETLHFIIVAGDEDCHDRSYGRFANNVQRAMQEVAQNIGMVEERDDLTIRFYQHISYLM